MLADHATSRLNASLFGLETVFDDIQMLCCYNVYAWLPYKYETSEEHDERLVRYLSALEAPRPRPKDGDGTVNCRAASAARAQAAPMALVLHRGIMERCMEEKAGKPLAEDKTCVVVLSGMTHYLCSPDSTISPDTYINNLYKLTALRRRDGERANAFCTRCEHALTTGWAICAECSSKTCLECVAQLLIEAGSLDQHVQVCSRPSVNWLVRNVLV